jgi:hypothetical protein
MHPFVSLYAVPPGPQIDGSIVKYPKLNTISWVHYIQEILAY